MSLRFKTILGVGLIEAVLLLILITTVLNYMRKSSEEALEDYVATTTQLFATTTKDAVLSFDLASLDVFVEEILKNNGVLYVRIFDNNNTVLSQGGDAKQLAKPFIEDKRYQDITDNVYDIDTQIILEEENYGHIEIGFSIEKINNTLAEAKRLAISIALLEMILVALFSFMLGIYLTKQLKILRNSARIIAAGDLDHQIHIETHDEIAEVADSFNKMITSLKRANQKNREYQEELLLLNKSLEDRVERRTHKISEQKKKLENAYEELKYTQKQLVQSEKMASIGQLAAGVAHEINNPVAFVKSNINSLKQYVNAYQNIIKQQKNIIDSLDQSKNTALNDAINKLDELWNENDIDFINDDIQTLLDESSDGASRVQEIVSGLKSYSRISDDVYQECDINQCLESTLKILNNELKYNCEVIKKFNPVPLIKINQGKITQVFTNLIVNALQAMKENGQLIIETRLDKDNTKILIRFSDNGKGIAEEHLLRLFDPFFTTKSVGEGTGLGLSISQGIIEEHGGTIEVDSTLDIGTTFIIYLPLINPQT